MKVVLKKEIGLHGIGSVLDVEDSVVIQLERDGMAERYTEEVPIKTVHKDILDAHEVIEPKRKGNPNWTKKQ